MTERQGAVAVLRRGATRRQGRTRSLLGTVVATTVLVLGAVGMVLPFVYMLSTSFRTGGTAIDLPPVWVTPPNVENYLAAVTGPIPLLRNMGNSLFIAVLVTLGQLVVCPLAGYAFARMQFRGRGLLFAILLTSLMVPIQVTVVPLFLLMSRLDLINNPWSLILPSLSGALGIFLMRQFFASLPMEIFDAARVDGATAFKTYLFIALPLVKPALTTLAIVTFLTSWNAYFAPIIFLSNVQQTTLPPAVVLMLGPYKSGDIGQVMAATAIAVVPCLIAFLVGQRWIVESLSRSGLKG